MGELGCQLLLLPPPLLLALFDRRKLKLSHQFTLLALPILRLASPPLAAPLPQLEHASSKPPGSRSERRSLYVVWPR